MEKTIHSRKCFSDTVRGTFFKTRVVYRGKKHTTIYAGWHCAFILTRLDTKHIISEGIGSKLETLIVADFRSKCYKSAHETEKQNEPKETTLFVIARLEINAFNIGKHRI